MSTTLQPSRWRSFRCHVVRMHYWQTMSNPDGERYYACQICRRERDTSFAAPIVG